MKLLDFGLAKFQMSALEAASSSSSRLATEAQASQPLTERGTVLGTFQYMAPEQLEGKEADARSDIFAFGAVLYEMATGQQGVLGQEPGLAHRVDPAGRSAVDLGDRADDPAGAEPRRQDLPRQGSRKTGSRPRTT